MSDDDEYLWSGEGTPSDEVVALERSLAPLRWRAQPLVDVVEVPASAKWWPMVVAGIVAAAAVLALSMWARPRSNVEESAPAANPVAPPSSDLKDPFGPRERGFTAPITDPDPRVDPPAPKPKTKPKTKPREISPDLKDPFADSPREPDSEGDLVDPFGDRTGPPPTPSPDLKDPFSGGR